MTTTNGKDRSHESVINDTLARFLLERCSLSAVAETLHDGRRPDIILPTVNSGPPGCAEGGRSARGPGLAPDRYPAAACGSYATAGPTGPSQTMVQRLPAPTRRDLAYSITRRYGTVWEERDMELGAFSISLAVEDLEASRVFYEKLGFEVIGGDPLENWQILRNGVCTIGIFQGMFEKNILTFNPGWDGKGETLDTFTDMRELQRELKAKGVGLVSEADENSTGPASSVALDPDGNPILVDQHV